MFKKLSTWFMEYPSQILLLFFLQHLNCIRIFFGASKCFFLRVVPSARTIWDLTVSQKICQTRSVRIPRAWKVSIYQHMFRVHFIRVELVENRLFLFKRDQIITQWSIKILPYLWSKLSKVDFKLQKTIFKKRSTSIIKSRMF